MHSCITCHRCSSPSRTSASVRHDSSLAIMTPLIGRPVSAHRASSWSPVVNGYVTGVWSGTMTFSPTSSSSSTNPPPTE